MPHLPQELGWLVQVPAAIGVPFAEAKTENFFSSFDEPHFGHFVPSHALDRTRTSES